MKKIIVLILSHAIFVSYLFSANVIASSNVNSKINWQDWSTKIFSQAKRENKFILLDLEAVWCHWCHVMDQKTYVNPAVSNLLSDKFISVKVDQDSRPDLSSRYQDYGWPATIIFAPDGTEIVKRAGYINPTAMTQLLQAIIDDPSPERNNQTQIKNYSNASHLSTELRQELVNRHDSRYDTALGSLNLTQKYIDRDSIEYALYLASQGNAQELQRARQTLDAGLALLDPAWGGIYQYSTHSNWNNPHFEKIMKIQAGYIQAYSRAYLLLGNKKYLTAAKAIENYLQTFLRDKNGAYYTSQDADLIQGEHSGQYFALSNSQRRAIGMPKIDKNIYARENGLAIEALVTLYEASHEPQYLQRAITAANWIIKNRQFKKGGFSHGKIVSNNDLAFLSDNLAMARALLNLYRVTSDRSWLKLAIKTSHFINQNFKDDQAGFINVALRDQIIKPIQQIDENISMTRFANLLSHYSGNKNHKELARHGMRYLASTEIALSRITEAGILMADIELNSDPIHVTVVGSKTKAQARGLLLAGLELPFWYKRVELWDKSEGPLLNDDVSYPQLSKPSAFLCTDSRCSLPLFSRTAIRKLVFRTVLANIKDNNNLWSR